MTAAADKLYLTQPAVSQQIRSLEEELKVPLLVRGVRQVKATMQGQLLYDYAKRILHLTQQAEVAIQTMSQEIAGHLRLGTINSIGLYMISPIVGLLLRHNPNLKIKLIYGSFQQVVQDMKSGNVDVAIIPDIKTEMGMKLTDFESRFVMKDAMMLVGSGRDSSIPSTLEFKDLGLKPLIVYSEMYPKFRSIYEQKLSQYGIAATPAFEADNVGTLKRVIESGLGWGFMPEHSITKQVKSGRLTHVYVDELSYETNLKIYSRIGEQHKSMADIFFRAFQQSNSRK